MKAQVIEIENKMYLQINNRMPMEVDIPTLRGFVFSFSSEEHYKETPGNTLPLSVSFTAGTQLLTVEDNGQLVFYSQNLLQKLFAKEISYITVEEYAEKYGKTISGIYRYCNSNRIPGAIVHGNVWLIPEDAPYPEDTRKK